VTIIPKEEDDEFVLSSVFESFYESKLCDLIRSFNNEVIALNLVGYLLNAVGNKCLKLLSEKSD